MSAEDSCKKNWNRRKTAETDHTIQAIIDCDGRQKFFINLPYCTLFQRPVDIFKLENIDSANALSILQCYNLKMLSSFFNLINQFAFIEILGAQTEPFLQGQLTSDIKNLSLGKTGLTACCDHKGRILFNGIISREAERFILVIPKFLSELAMTHLNKFAVFSKVTVKENQNLAGIMIFKQSNDGFDCQIGNQDSIAVLEQQLLEKHYTQLDLNNYLYRLILLGLVFIQPAISGELIPQMINWQKLGGVSFSKGCYVGQEIIARTEHLGQLKRHLYRLQFENDQSIAIGESLFNNQRESIGQIVALSHENKIMLAVIQDRAVGEPIFSFSGLQLALIEEIE